LTATWRCTTCRGRGTIEVRANESATALAQRAKIAHVIVQPSCRGEAELVTAERCADEGRE